MPSPELPFPPFSTLPPPRAWQRDALAAWVPGMRGVVKVVTGGGKTMLAFYAIAHFLAKFPDGQVFVLVPTTQLLDQWNVDLVHDGGLTAAQIALYGGGHAPPTQARQFNVLVINSARRQRPSALAYAPSLLIVDECHRSASRANRSTLQGTFEAALGLSATPERQYDVHFESYVAPRLGPVIFEYGYRDALRDGVVSEFVLNNVQVPLSTSEQESVDRLSAAIARRWRDGSADELKRLSLRRASIVRRARARVPSAVHLVLRNPGAQTLLFHESIEDATQIADRLNARGCSAVMYHSGVNPVLRVDNLRLFKAGLVQCLVTCRALDEGMNVPEASVAVLASSTRSIRQRIQRLGRVLRRAPGKGTAIVYTLYSTDSEAGDLLAEESQLLGVADVVWSRLKRPD